MNPLVGTTLVGMLLTALVSAFVLGRNPQHAVNRHFFAMGLFVSLWGAGILLRFDATGPAAARVWFCFAMAGAMGTVWAFVRFCRVFLVEADGASGPARAAYGLEVLGALSGAAIYVLLPTSLGLRGLTYRDGHFGTVTGPAFLAAVAWGLLSALAAVVLVLWAARRLPAPHRSRALIVAAAPVAPVVFFGVSELAWKATTQGTLVGEPYFAIAFFEMVIAYGVFRHGLMSLTPEEAAGQLVQSLPDGLVLLDADGRIRTANPAFQEMTGLNEPRLRGRLLYEFVSQPGEGAGSVEDVDFDRTQRVDMQLWTRSASGESVPVSVTVKPVHDAVGRQRGSIMVFRDLRPVRQLEAGLVQAEKLAALGQLAAGVAHEINNPLSVMMGLSELGESSAAGEKARRYFSKINAQALRTRSIVTNLLLFARKGEGRRMRTDLHAILEEVVDLVRIGLKKGTVTVEKRFGPGPAPVVCEPEKMRQVFLNLLQNAFQALEGRESGRVLVRTETGGGRVRVQVEDTGPGIAPEHLTRVFDPFFTTKEVGRGTGLGLSICHGIVEAHGGEIEAGAAEGGGARFTVSLPSDAGPAA